MSRLPNNFCSGKIGIVATALLVLVAMFIVWLVKGGPNQDSGGPFLDAPWPLGSGQTYGSLAERILPFTAQNQQSLFGAGATKSSNQTASLPSTTKESSTLSQRSPYYGLVTISRGNAASEQSSNREYIVLQVAKKLPQAINLTAWVLRNGSDKRLYYQSGRPVQIAGRSVALPTGVLVWRPKVANVAGPIMVYGGEKIYVISGFGPQIDPYLIRQSFRVNKCSGYISANSHARFYPSLKTACPTYRDEPALQQLPEDCYTVIKKISRCQEPDFQEERCRLDEKFMNQAICLVPEHCRTLAKKYFSYQSCVSHHQQDADFLLPEWRVYLGQVWEMWSKERETISLLDETGRLVAELTY